MKKLLMFLSCLYIQTTQTCKFLKSWKQEFQEVAEYYTDPAIETVQDVKNEILADPAVSKKRHHRDQLMSIQQVLKNCPKEEKYKKFLIDMQDIQNTFDALKHTMQIPQEVEIWYVFDQNLNTSALMSYMPFDRTVYVYPNSLDLTPAYRLFTLIHELTHIKQHQSLGLLKHHLHVHNQKEHEADTNAAQTIACPLCFRVILAEQLLRETTSPIEQRNNNKSNGYLMSDDLQLLLEQKCLNKLCSLHQNMQDLEILTKYNTTEDLNAIITHDFQDGSMLNRLY